MESLSDYGDKGASKIKNESDGYNETIVILPKKRSSSIQQKKETDI